MWRTVTIIALDWHSKLYYRQNGALNVLVEYTKGLMMIKLQRIDDELWGEWVQQHTMKYLIMICESHKTSRPHPLYGLVCPSISKCLIHNQYQLFITPILKTIYYLSHLLLKHVSLFHQTPTSRGGGGGIYVVLVGACGSAGCMQMWLAIYCYFIAFVDGDISRCSKPLLTAITYGTIDRFFLSLGPCLTLIELML